MKWTSTHKKINELTEPTIYHNTSKAIGTVLAMGNGPIQFRFCSFKKVDLREHYGTGKWNMAVHYLIEQELEYIHFKVKAPEHRQLWSRGFLYNSMRDAMDKTI